MCPFALKPSRGTSKAFVDTRRPSGVDTRGEMKRESDEAKCNLIPGSGRGSVVHATLSPNVASGQVSPKRNQSRPSCSNEEPRSVPTTPKRVSVRLNAGTPHCRSRSPVS